MEIKDKKRIRVFFYILAACYVVSLTLSQNANSLPPRLSGGFCFGQISTAQGMIKAQRVNDTLRLVGVTSEPFYKRATVPGGPASTPAIDHKWFNSYSASTGKFGQTQPDARDISGFDNYTGMKMYSLKGPSNTWSPSYANLSTGTTLPTVTGRYTRIGQEVMGTIEVKSTAYTASRQGRTTFTLPYAPVGYATVSVADAYLYVDIPNGVLNSTYLFSPKWMARQWVIMSFHYETAAAF